MTDSHNTAPTRFVEANGVRYAYRRFGTETGIPVVFLQHFRGGLDNWDPLVTDGLAKDRPVILFDNAGVASSGGQPADSLRHGKACGRIHPCAWPEAGRFARLFTGRLRRPASCP